MPDSKDTFAQLESAIESASAMLDGELSAAAAGAAALSKLLAAQLQKTVVKEGDEYCVIGESGKNFGCYESKKAAEKRLAEIKQFSEKAAQASDDLRAAGVDEIRIQVLDDVPETTQLLDQALQRLAAAPEDGPVAKAAASVREITKSLVQIFKEAEVDEAVKAHHEDKDEKGKKRTRRRKGLPAEVAEGGIHIHGTTREDSTTKRDGPHEHIFILDEPVDFGPRIGVFPEGTMFFTEEDGSHTHELAAPNANETKMDGAHFHAVHLPDGEVIETSEDGEHAHELQVVTTAFDGMHQHELELPDGQTLKSISPGDFWQEVLRAPSQSHLPLVPQASMFAALPMWVWEKLLAMEDLPIAALKSAEAEEAERADYKSGNVQALKVPDPRFIVKRLRFEKSAGLLSLQKRVSRVDQAQALVNELTPLKFEDSFIWGIVKHGECVKYDSFKDVPEDVLDGIDPHTRKEFEKNAKREQAEVYYLPFELMKAFDEPLKLVKPPAGRRFASKVDLEADVVDVVKCVKCRAPFELADEGLHVCQDCLSTNVTKSEVASRDVRIVKSEEDGEERTVFGAVLVPDDPDAQGDIYNAEEVRKAAHGYMEVYGGRMKVMHKGALVDDLVVIETYVSKSEVTFGDETFPVGTWFMTARVVDDELWTSVKKGEFTGFSIGGSAIREPLA